MPHFGELRFLHQMGDITLAGLANGDIISYDVATGQWVNIPAVAAEVEEEYTYLVWGVAPTVYVKNGATGEITTYANEVLALHYCADNGPALGTTIFVKSPFATTARITITRGNLTFKSDLIVSNGADRPKIQRMTIDATANPIHNIKIDGFNIQELRLYANGNEITDVYCHNSIINKNAAYHGVILEGDGTTDGWIDNVHFIRCYLITYGGDGNTWGAVTWKNVRFVTEVYFNHCVLECYDDDNCFFLCYGDAQPDSVYLLNCRFYMDTATTGLRIFRQLIRTAGYVIGFGVQWIGGRIEGHSPYTILEVDNSPTNAMSLMWRQISVQIQSAHANAHTLFVINNANWTAFVDNSWHFAHNRISGAGNWTFGAVTPSANLLVERFNNTGVNPLAASVPAVGASPVTFGPYIDPMCMEIVGNITGVVIRGQASSMPAAAAWISCHMLYPGDTIVITYPAGAPVVTLWPM